jgi:hypothetical protein
MSTMRGILDIFSRNAISTRLKTLVTYIFFNLTTRFILVEYLCQGNAQDNDTNHCEGIVHIFSKKKV